MTTPPDEESRIASIAEMRAEQERQGGILDRLVAFMDGGKPASEPPGAKTDPVDAPDIGEQMRQAVRDVNAETAAKAPEAKPEVPPAEAGQPRKNRLHGALYGREGK